MGNARFYYYPDPAGTIETIDLGTVSAGYPSDRQDWEDTALAQARRGDGRVFSAYTGASSMVSIQADVIHTQSVVDDVRAMLNFMKRGGAVGFALDTDTAWCGYTKSPVYRGVPNVAVSGNVWYEPSPAISAGGRLTIESPPPEGIREEVIEVTGLTASSAALTMSGQTPRFTYAADCVVRDPGFWPVLILPSNQAGGNLLRSTIDRIWELRLLLYYDVGATLAISKMMSIRQTDDPRLSGNSLTDALRLTTRVETQMDTSAYTSSYRFGP